MNIDLKDIFKKVFKGHKKAVGGGNPFTPEADWRNIVIGFTVLNLLIVAWSSYLFFFAQEADPSLTSEAFDPTSHTQNVAKIETITASFQAKAVETNILLLSKPEIADPS